MHNGYLKSLREGVHFYNTRDVCPFDAASRYCPAGTKEKVTTSLYLRSHRGPTEEHDDRLVGLTDRGEEIVAFLKMLSNGFTTPYPDSNTYMGSFP
jgi:cytochrome c peroxidase